MNSEIDAEGEEVDEEYVDTYVSRTVPAEMPISETTPDNKLNVVPSSLLGSDTSSAEEEDNTSNTESNSDAESQWAAESDVAEDAELEAGEGNHCVY